MQQIKPSNKCAKFGTNSKKIIASGDDKNCVQIWQIGESKPIATLSSQNNSNAQVEVARICFSFCEAEIFSGSNRGIINVWDVENKRLLQTLKGHSACVNALCIYPSDENKNLLFSGAYDTSIKLWDLRSKTSVNQFKGHTMQINTLAVSPNSKLLASGSNDGSVKLWDIAQGKLITSFTQHDSQITCLAFNPLDKLLASGGADRCIRIWNLQDLNQISMTRTDSTPIQSILINDNGKVIYSATHESLKVWDIEHDCQLIDNVESMWKGVQDMIITQDQEQLLGLASNPQSGFSLHGVSLKSIGQDNRLNEQKQTGNANSKQRGRTPDRRQEMVTKAQEPENKQKGKPTQQIQEQNYINQDNQLEKQKSNEVPKDYQSLQPQPMFPPIQPQNYNSPYINNPHNNNNQNGLLQYQLQQQQSQQQQQQLLYQYQIQQTIQINQQNQQQNLSSQQQKNQIVQPLNNQPQYHSNQQAQLKQQMPQNNQQEDDEYNDNFEEDPDMTTTSELTLSQFMLGDHNKEKFKQVDLIHEINKDHNRINQILSQRMKYIKPILSWWINNNIKSAINAINQVIDPSILQDALSLYSQQPKFSSIPIENFPLLLEKARILIESRFAFHIKTGLDFTYKSLCLFRDEILNIKLFNQLSKADLAREERIQKYDKVIEQLKIIAQMPKMQKLIERNKDELTELAKKLQLETAGLLKKINPNNSQN
ncbi:unnamed protein product (macronuclear) [Paramecium tetraurelia]|uniref:Katanin p80 WD40 repeat-containing subunit B1 homolog n=1 Tax=Paramecium tetraurelia TaxID=5888 RepID=A0C4Z7_PARTE|nr:uncharacterized protein GSPATT00006363001 [Paramecium tetraurelia]CAK65864.1 unnamed protein product [Paramecium tetraurelia]|eukprot:XP_001433261.1 hypothetical protein (macronuclear) [Paramecium tetraurelia strain d4-2]